VERTSRCAVGRRGDVDPGVQGGRDRSRFRVCATSRFGRARRDRIRGRGRLDRWFARPTAAAESKGGRRTGATSIVRGAMKPISTLRRPLAQRRSRDRRRSRAAGYERSDVCAVSAASVVAEAMVAMVARRRVAATHRRGDARGVRRADGSHTELRSRALGRGAVSARRARRDGRRRFDRVGRATGVRSAQPVGAKGAKMSPCASSVVLTGPCPRLSCPVLLDQGWRR
jgi:hypothetical protein